MPRSRGLWGTLLAAALLALAGCGFQLRGSVEIPAELNPVYLQADAGSPVRRALLDLLSGSGVEVTDNVAEAQMVLRILAEARTSRVAAVDINGKTLAYELHYMVRFDALGDAGTRLVAPQSLDLVRTFDNPDVEVLGKRLEEALIYEDFATDAADRILTRLRVALR
ncbi:LPS assembly lipoprotein LptE [Marichromatium bheemlicum]|nr:LPS assembly lipoprotein LptE [Marichromatium bheemlicum]